MADRCPVCGNVDRNRICHPDDDTTSEANVAGSIDHVCDGLKCWCRPYRDTEDPEVIIHRSVIHD